MKDLAKIITLWIISVLLTACGGGSDQSEQAKLLADGGTTGNVCFYQHTNYSGLVYCMDSSSATNMPTGWNNYASSVKVAAGYTVQLYDGDAQTGTLLTLTADEPSLVNRSFNDKASSYSITAPVCFFQHTNYGGTSICVDSDTANMPGGWDNYASSVKVKAGLTIELYDSTGQTGTKLTLTGNEPSLVNRSFNDMASSYKFVTGTTTTTATTTTTTAASCSYPNWVSGTNYALNTIVKYVPNGNFYKVVNVGTNGSDGTDPTVSTWYWAQHTCSGGGGGGGGGSFVVSEAQFNLWFPAKNPFYTYADFLTAMTYYPTFAKSGDVTKDKQEAAAFFANLHHESDHLKAVREYATANWPNYCDVNWVQVTCDSTNMNDQYFGRGPIQISWTSNYAALSTAMGLGTQLKDNPELLATNAQYAWRSALWYWMTQTGPNNKSAHAAITGGYGFGETIKSINGAKECVGVNPAMYVGPAQMQVRVDYYTDFTGDLGVTPGSNLTC